MNKKAKPKGKTNQRINVALAISVPRVRIMMRTPKKETRDKLRTRQLKEKTLKLHRGDITTLKVMKEQIEMT